MGPASHGNDSRLRYTLTKRNPERQGTGSRKGSRHFSCYPANHHPDWSGSFPSEDGQPNQSPGRSDAGIGSARAGLLHSRLLARPSAEVEQRSVSSQTAVLRCSLVMRRQRASQYARQIRAVRFNDVRHLLAETIARPIAQRFKHSDPFGIAHINLSFYPAS